MDQEILAQAAMLQSQIEELEKQLEFTEVHVQELQQFQENLKSFMSSNEKSSLSMLGKGVYAKTNISDKELFVEVGSGIVVRKSPQETSDIIKDQLKKFSTIREQLKAHLEMYVSGFQNLVQNIKEN